MIPGVVDSSGGKVLPSTSDDFNRADSSIISTSTKKWTETSGDWSISSNRLATSTSAASYPLATLRTNTKNATVQVGGVSGDGWGVAFWVVDENNWYSATTDMTQSSVQNPATSGTATTTTHTGNYCPGGRNYNGVASGAGLWPPYAGTCYDVCCTSYSGGTPATYEWRTPSGLYCYQDGIHCGGSYVLFGYTAGDEYLCGGTCCCSLVMTDPGTPGTCATAVICNCCVYNNANDPGCPGDCGGQGSPQPTYTTSTYSYTNPETRTWTYSQTAIIRRAIAGSVTTVATSSAVTSSETVAAAGAAGSPTRPTSITVVTNGEGISVSAPGAAGGTISVSNTATGANRGKKHGAAIAPASVSQATSIDNFIYTQPA